jgi:hypothetical protein
VSFKKKYHIIIVKGGNKMFRNYRRCSCINNSYQNSSSDLQQDMIENQCDNVNSSYEEFSDSCSCGFDEDYNVFPENPMLAQSYVPFQYMDKTFKPCIGLKMGTIFPELVSPYVPGQSMEEMDYIMKRNVIGKGCNQCQ